MNDGMESGRIEEMMEGETEGEKRKWGEEGLDEDTKKMVILGDLASGGHLDIIRACLCVSGKAH
jgi:hypothetical protein